MTASRVVNDSAPVLDSKREKVLKAVDALGYVPNAAARSLAGRKQCRILLLYSNPSPAFLSEFLVGSMDGASTAESLLVVERWHGEESCEDFARRQAANRIDAVLLPPPLCDDSSLIAAFTGNQVHVAQIATGYPLPDVQAVTIDDEMAAHRMTSHLVQMGHSCIGFIAGNADQSCSRRRLLGYKRALLDAGIAPDEALIADGQFTFRSGLEAAEQLLRLSNRPTAIFASNDDMAAAVISVAHRYHLEVPRDLSVCGFDDSTMAWSVWPEITTIRQPIAEMAKRATAMLSDAVHRKVAPYVIRHVRLEFELIERSSTAPPRRNLRPSDFQS